jgi:ATP-dependent DNA ligase
MLACSGPIPTRGDWSFEVKWDAFRAIVSTEGEPLRVRSRRGWDMTALVPELSALPVAATLDSELVAFGEDGRPTSRSCVNGCSCVGTSTECTFEAVCAYDLEGVVAKKRAERYRRGERGWVKTKNREYRRYEMERESAINKRRMRH